MFNDILLLFDNYYIIVIQHQLDSIMNIFINQ